MTTDPTLRALIDLRDASLQKARIQFGNRLDAIARGDDTATAEVLEILDRWQTRFAELEAEADRDIREMAKDHAIIARMCDVKGVGLILAAKVVAMIDIERANTVSALWRYAGYAVVDGQRERPTKGEKLHYNKRLKTACYLVGTSFLRTGSPYRSVYDDARLYYEANRPEWTKAHQHQAAMRKMIKMFLAHLWLHWRTVENLPTRDLWVMDYGGHAHYRAPEEFGWMPITD